MYLFELKVVDQPDNSRSMIWSDATIVRVFADDLSGAITKANQLLGEPKFRRTRHVAPAAITEDRS